MKCKRRKAVEVPPRIKSFIDSVTSSSLDNIEEALKCFTWEFDKGDFSQWVALFNHFDLFLEKYIKPRKDLHIEDNSVEPVSPFPREAVLQILRVTRVILENCTNKHLYSSYEHLSLLLASPDADVIEASLQVLTAFLKKAVAKCCIRDTSLVSKLFAFSQGWGGKVEGLGLVTCSLKNGCDPVASEIGSTLHFEFYAGVDDLSNSIAEGNVKQGLQVIHLPNINLYSENELGLLNKLVKEHNVPPRLRFSLLTRLRFARAFSFLSARHQYACIRLLAFIVLVQISHDSEELTTYFNNEPEFISELVSILSFEDEIPEKIRILAILSLVALCQDRAHQPMVLTSLTSGGNQGILPSLTHKVVNAITGGSTRWSIDFVEALLLLVNDLVTSTPGSLALREAGFIPAILPLLKDTNTQHLGLVTTAVHVLEGFLDYNNPATTLFRDLGGLDDTITRLKVELSFVEEVSLKLHEESSKGKQVVSTSAELDTPYSVALVSYHRRLLLKGLLRTISLAAFVPGSSARIGGSEESVLPHCLSIIFRKGKAFGGGVFSLAANVMIDLIHRDPTCFPILDAADLPRAFLDAILDFVPCSYEAVRCIPQSLDALCLNNNGLQQVRERNALRCFVKIFTSSSYLRALSEDTVECLSTSLDELMRHASSLRSSGVDMFIEILSSISKIGSGMEFSTATGFLSSSTPIPMEIDLEERRPALLDEVSMVGSSDQIVGLYSDVSSVNVESFLLEFVRNAARLLQHVLHNADTCLIFIEKKGIEAVLKLFTMPIMPSSGSIGQNISAAFKGFPSVHYASLSRAVCCFIREHLKLTNELLASVCGSKLSEIESSKQMEVLKCLSSLEGLLSLSNFLLKGVITMVSEVGSSNADVVVELGRTYKEILWQISLFTDSKADEKRDTDQGVGSLLSNVAGRDSDDDGNIIPEIRYTNPIPIRNNSGSLWTPERDFASLIRSSSSHRHGRHGFSRVRGSRISRQLDISRTDSDGSISPTDHSFILEPKKKSPSVIASEIMIKLGVAIRSFHGSLVKTLTARYNSLSTSVSKSVMTALAKLFYDALSYSGHSAAGLEMSLSVKCRYLGKVVDDMVSLTFDSRRRVCYTLMVNGFYVNGTFKELLTTYEATSQLLWTLPFSLPTPVSDQGNSVNGIKVSHSSWLLDTLQSYSRLLEYHVNSSLLLSPHSSTQAQNQADLLVQPVPSGLSIGLFSIPRDPEQFVRMLHSQVLDVILPIWNHAMFPNCNPAFVTSVISIITHIYSGVGDLKHSHSGITRSAGQRLTAPLLDESTIATIVEMGFTRTRAEEALRSVRTNSVEVATDWLFSHPEEPVQEDTHLVQELALSLGNSSETSKDDIGDEPKPLPMEDREVERPPVDDILAASMKLFQSSDSFAFPLTDLLLTLCNRNKGKDRPRVVPYLIQQLKLCPSDFAEGTGTLCSISHLLALLLRQDSSTREIAAENGAVSAVLDILTNFRVRNDSKNDVSVTKAVSALLLMLDSLLQSKLKFQTENVDASAKSSSDPFEADFSLETPSSTVDKKPPADDLEKEPESVFEKILGKPTGYLTLDESQRALVMACDLIKQHVPAMIMQSVLQVTARLTKTHALATQFLESGGLSALFTIPMACMFPGFDSFASSIIRHLLEDPQTLQTAMELEIKQAILGTISRHASRLSPRVFLTSMAPVISRDPAIFMRAATAACQLESSGGRMIVVLSKEKEKDKEKLRAFDNGVHSNDSIRISEQKNDMPGKISRSHKRVPASLSQVVDQLLEIIMSYPSPEDPDVYTSSLITMELEEPSIKEKGKSKVEERKMDMDSISERSALLAKVTFVLKLMSDILLMYIHAVGVLLRRDSEISQQKGSGQASGMGNGGILHHILHHLLPLSSDKTAESSDEWKDNLSEKASCFLVALCGRTSEGRRRVIFEIVRTFSTLTYTESNSSKSILTPDKKVLAFADLVNSILAKNSSSNIPGPGCSPDIAKTMIDGGMVQSLSMYLRVIDLDHPDSPKVVNLILKALESLTRAANASDPVFKLDGLNKKRSTQGATESQTTVRAENSDHDQNANELHEAADVVQSEQRVHGSPRDDQNHDANLNQSMDQDEQVDREGNSANNPAIDEGAEYMHEMDVGGALQNTALDFRVEHRTDDDMGDEDDEDMGDDGEDDEDDEEDDDDEDIAEEGAALMSLADTDVEDHDGTGIGGEYTDDMIDEDEGDFPNNRVIEVRLRDGLAGFDRLRVLRSGNASSFVDFDAEQPFPRINTDELFPLHRPLGVDRRRQSGSRSSIDRSGSDGSSFPHPLFLRPSQSGSPITSMLSSAGNTARELDPLSFGSFDVAQIYMFDAGFPSDHTAVSGMGDRLVGASPLFDFPLGMDLHMSGRRGGDSRWTDDGQPQIGGHAAAASIAQAVEAQFVSQLRGVTSLDDPSAQGQTEFSAGQAKQQSSNANSQPLVSLDNLCTGPSENHALEHINNSVHQLPDLVVDTNSCPSNMSLLMTDAQYVVGDEGSHVVPERSPDVLDVRHNGSERMHSEEGTGPSASPLDVVPEMDTSLDLQNVVIGMLDNSDVPADSHDAEFQNGCRYEPSGSEIHSTNHALIDSCSTMPDLSDANAISAHTNVGVDVNSMDTIVNEGSFSLTGYSGEDLSTRQGIDVPQEPTQTDQSIVNDASNANEIDPTFLEALPEDLRAEVLASQQAQSAPTATYAPPHAEEIDPEFLAALPPDIQAEVLAQQRAQRTVHSQQGTGQPVDMDNASIIATFPPDLREEVLLTSSEAVLSALPSALLAEAQMLRDRAASHYHARSSLFGGSHRFGGRRMAVDRQTVVDRGVGFTVGERAVSMTASSMKVKEVEGMPLLDENALKALIRLLRLAQPLGKGLLQRLLLNLCANSVTRTILVGLLVDMIRPEADGSSGSAGLASHRLYGCQWNVVYGRTQPTDGLPPLVSRRILETLTYLATNHSAVANILFYFDHSLITQSPTFTASENKKEKGKEKVLEAKPQIDAKETSQGDLPLILFLKLLKRPLFLRSSAHLEQVMGLLQVVVHNVLAKIESQNLSGENTAMDCPGTRKESSSSDQNANLETNHIPMTEVPTSGSSKAVKPYDILLELPEQDLQNLCSILAQERLSDKVYTLAADILKKLAFVVPSHRKFFASELAGLAHCLSASAVGELTTLRSMNMLGLSSGSIAGAAILRVLQALGGLISIDGHKIEDIGAEHEEQSILWNLNASLEPLWQELSECITVTEAKLGQSSTIALPVPLPDAGDIFGGYSTLSPPLPPGTQCLLPFIEAFFVLCEKLQTSQTITLTDTNVTAREVKECASSSLSPSLKCGGASSLTFLKIAEKHRRLLNVFIRQNPSLLEKSLSLMLKVPRLIDFDNKRAYFRSRVRQRHDQHSSAPLRISVQRAYVLEDSYNQLRLRPSQDLKGRLSVQFLGEEGIDAGGLTREWYQLLSRVIFDKGALLFTTVGNNATFQPNPNSVYQTGHLSYFKFVGRVVAKALFDGQLLDVYFTRPFYKHILGVKVTYHDIEAVDPDYYKNLKWMLENDVSDIPDLTFSMDADEEKHILYEKTEVTDYELIPGGRNIRVTEETKHEYVDLVAEHRLTTAIRPQINSFLEGFSELIPRDLISIFNDKELELLISGLPEIDIDDLRANTEYTGYTAASTIICWFWDVVKAFNEEDMARFLQFVTGTSKVPLDGFKALQGISGPQRFQIHKAYGAPERLPSAHTCFNQLDLPEYSSKEQLDERLLLAIHEASEGFGFG